jgi:hypothetical protein
LDPWVIWHPLTVLLKNNAKKSVFWGVTGHVDAFYDYLWIEDVSREDVAMRFFVRTLEGRVRDRGCILFCCNHLSSRLDPWVICHPFIVMLKNNALKKSLFWGVTGHVDAFYDYLWIENV